MPTPDTPPQGAADENVPRSWFDQGFDAFSRSFPQVAATIPFSPFYLCPLCLAAGPEEALKDDWLSREDVPPKALGGKRIVLTCRACNNTGGHSVDAHAKKEADLVSFLTRQRLDVNARLKTESGCVPVRLSVTSQGISAVFVPKAASPSSSNGVQNDLFKAAEPEGWKNFEFTVEFASFSPRKAATSWLRSAYLVWFTALGYRFIWRPELEVVRHRISNPESAEPEPFRIVLPEPVTAPTLLCVESPEELRSYTMLYERHVVFLPRYGDTDLYARLARQPEGPINLSGRSYPWPSRPLFLHDTLPGRSAAGDRGTRKR